jgi:hypothetical protein
MTTTTVATRPGYLPKNAPYPMNVTVLRETEKNYIDHIYGNKKNSFIHTYIVTYILQENYEHPYILYIHTYVLVTYIHT